MSAATEVFQPQLFPNNLEPKAAFRHIRNYLAGRMVGATRDDVLLDEVLKCLFCKLYLERGDTGNGVFDSMDALESAKLVRQTFQIVRKDFPEIYPSETEILLSPEHLLQVFESLSFDLLDATSDPVGDAFEVFAGSESRARSGQFFTPRNATDLLVNMIAPKKGERVIDPACGAGGFLASVVRYHRENGLTSKAIAKEAGNLQGIEKDSYLSGLARIHVSILSGAHHSIACGDSLAMENEDAESIENEYEPESFDVVLTNPPFGVKIVSASESVLNGFELARKWKLDADGDWAPTAVLKKNTPPQILFLERCLKLLRPGGRMGLVLPESVLSNKSYRYAIEYLQIHSQIRAVVGMPESLFKTSGKGGTHTKTCLLIVEKNVSSRRPKIFMAEAKWCGKDSRAREIPNDDLPEIQANYFSFRKGKLKSSNPLGFVVAHKEIQENVLCPRYYDPGIKSEIEALSNTHDFFKIGDLIDEGILEIKTGDEVGKLAYGTGEIPFVRTSDISNWEIKIDPKHGVSSEIYEGLRTKQNVNDGDILMVKDGTYLIGTCGIVTKYDRQLVYQSHLYKIRIMPNEMGLSPFLLLAMLSTPLVKRQIKSKQFTQDIIDSLGERIQELELPFPKDLKQRKKVEKMVKKAVEERMEARELARKATLEIAMGG